MFSIKYRLFLLGEEMIIIFVRTETKIVHTGRFVYPDLGDVHGSLGIIFFESVVFCHLIFLL